MEQKLNYQLEEQKKTFETNISDLIFIESDYNKNKAKFKENESK